MHEKYGGLLVSELYWTYEPLCFETLNFAEARRTGIRGTGTGIRATGTGIRGTGTGIRGTGTGIGGTGTRVTSIRGTGIRVTGARVTGIRVTGIRVTGTRVTCIRVTGTCVTGTRVIGLDGGRVCCARVGARCRSSAARTSEREEHHYEGYGLNCLAEWRWPAYAHDAAPVMGRTY